MEKNTPISDFPGVIDTYRVAAKWSFTRWRDAPRAGSGFFFGQRGRHPYPS